MALTMEDILLERQRRKPKPSLEYTNPIDPEKEKYDADLAYMLARHESPPAPEPSLLERVSPVFERLGRQKIQEAELGAAQAPVITGVGEAALSVGTGFAGGLAGIGGAIQEYVEKPPRPYPRILDSEGYASSPIPENYWKNLVDKARRISEEFTYQPKTEEGKAAIGAIAPAFEALHWFSRAAADSTLSKMIFTEDQREAVAYAHELVTMMAVGELGAATLRGIGRKRVSDFQKAYTEAAKAPDDPTTTQKLSAISDEIVQKASGDADIAAKFNPERVARLREKQTEQGFADVDAGLAEMERIRITERDPTIAPRMREQGKAVIDRLVENPDNVEYQNAAIAYMEKTRGFGDETVGSLRSRINEFVQVEEPTLQTGATAPVSGYSPTIFHPSPTPGIRPSRKSRTKVREEPEVPTTEGIPPVEEGNVRLYRVDLSPEARADLPKGTEFTRSHVANESLEYIRSWRDANAKDGDIYYIDVPFKPDILEPNAPISISAQQRTQLKLFEKAPVEKDFDAIAPEWLQQRMTGLADMGDKLGITDRIIELAKQKKVANDIVDMIPELQKVPLEDRANIVRSVRDRAGIEPAGPIGFTGMGKASRRPVVSETEATLAEVRQTPSRGKPSTKSAEEKIQAIEEVNAQVTKESTVKMIQEALEKNIDIREVIYKAVPGVVQSDYALMRYELARKFSRKGMDESARRGVMEIVSDIAELFAFDVDSTKLGSNLFNVALSHRQMMAAQRLVADAVKDGKSLIDVMMEQKVDPVAMEVYKRYLEPIMTSIKPPSGVGPKNMRLDGQAMTNDPVMERHLTQDGLLGPALFSNEMGAIQGAVVRDAPGPLSVTTPGRTFKAYGQPIYDMVMPNYRKVMKNFTEEAKGVQKDLRALENTLKYNDRRVITEAIESGSANKLQGKHKEGYDLLSEGGQVLINRANEVRTALGIAPLSETTTPLEFIRSIMSARSDGVYVNIVKTPASAIDGIVQSYSAKQMQPTWTQKALRLSPEMDVFRQYNKFATDALEQIHVTPLTHKLRDLVNYAHLDMKKMDGSQYRVEVENPGLRETINEWSNFVDGMPIRSIKGLDPYLRKFNENMAWSMLSWNLRSVMAQPAAIVNTFFKAGMENTFDAIVGNFASIMGKSTERAEAIAGSSIISTRKNQSLYEEIGGNLSEGFVKDFKRIGKDIAIAAREGRSRDLAGGAARIGLSAMEWADYESAVTSLMAFRRQGKAKGLKGEELNRFADDGLVITQASGARGDTTPLQRMQLARTVTQFGTFGFSDVNFIISEVLKPRPNMPMKEVLANVGRYVGISTVATLAYEAAGIDSPLPNPVKEISRSVGKGDDILSTAFRTAFEVAGPYSGIFGSLRMGQPVGGPLLGTIYDLSRSASDKPGAKPIGEPISKLSGVPGAGTLWKLHRGNPDANPLQRLLTYDPKSGAKGGGSLGSGLK